MKRGEPLHRKLNTQTHGVAHRTGGDFRTVRCDRRMLAEEITRLPMKQGQRRGRDYTPLHRFLRSRVGQPWDVVFAEAVGRLDSRDPIFDVVALHPDAGVPVVRVGESSYVSGLHVDAGGILRLVDPGLDAAGMVPDCTCCTHTFNGVVFGTPSA
ncbi:hypothetical protein [Marilutibacter spongiae]|uniref:Uncharacterized protein n=1 Tax=Marilutibacter spongiae TaxID=2025720 RepID=A0A7W3TKV7_9GAMM|nr:hypothetical protein [Lysobacter spongiae]MBB1059824.1 hypothetical protein [Lysobacter spongiae]